MENLLKLYWTEMSEDARRQFIDANSVFTAWEAARKGVAEVKGGMFWKRQDGGEYLTDLSDKFSKEPWAALRKDHRDLWELQS